MPELQWFEKDTLPELPKTTQSEESIQRPLIAIVSEPMDFLHCDGFKSISAFRELSGKWDKITAKPGSTLAQREYSARAGPMALSDYPIKLFENGELISEANTDETGKVLIVLPSKEPRSGDFTVSMLPEMIPINNPFQQSFNFSVWLLTCRVQNKTDRWWRLAGRSFSGGLPRLFWNNPLNTIGLAAPIGTQVFIDLAPVFGDQSMTLEYGISAFCNTSTAYPTQDACLAARRNTWWNFVIEAFNGTVKKTVTGDLNVDRHLRVTLTSSDISAEVIKAEGAET